MHFGSVGLLCRQDEAARLTLAISEEKSAVSALVENRVGSLAGDEAMVVAHLVSQPLYFHRLSLDLPNTNK